MFIKLVEKLCSLLFTSTELILIAEHIQLFFFKKYVQPFDDANLKPKTHFVFYYSHMIEQFGTLVKTVRFKTNSISVKGLYSSNKKRKNIHPNALYR